MKGKVPVAGCAGSQPGACRVDQAGADRKYKFDPNKFSIEGKGWDVPADPSRPDNNALNRRVEISVFPPEQQ